jgi:hypothetical protein
MLPGYVRLGSKSGSKAMTKESKAPPPPINIAEFTTITGLVFTQLYKEFPVAVTIDQTAIESAMGVSAPSSSHVLPSGKSFTEVFAHSLNWLRNEGYVRSGGFPYGDQVKLTTKGLATLNAVPQGLSTTVGSTLATNASSRDWSSVGDVVGGIIGGFTKSLSGS